MHSVPVPINVRCYSNSDIIVRRSEVTLRATSDSCTAAINVVEVLMVERLSAALISFFSILVGFLPRNMVRRSAILSTI